MRSPGLSYLQLEHYADKAMSFVRALLYVLLVFALGVMVFQSAEAQTNPSISFNGTATSDGAGKVNVTLTWSTTPAAASCTASGDAAWTGTKTASGSLVINGVTPPKSYVLDCAWPADSTATLSWVAPTTNTDGSALAKCAAATDTGPCLAKYRICRGTSATALTDCRDHNFPNSTTTPWSGTLAIGTHFFAIKAVTGQGVESALSNVASKTITSGFTATQSFGIKMPGQPTGFAVE